MFTQREVETLLDLVGNALDQDHDSPSGDYLWFLVPDVPMDPTQEQLAEVRESLTSAHAKLVELARKP